MRQFRLPVIFLVLIPLLILTFLYAQSQSRPLVGFVVDRTVAAASLRDEGPDGLSRLGDLFGRLGASITVVRLGQSIPEEVDLVVLANPLNQLNERHVTRLWEHMNQGKHLLLAFDPNSFANVNSVLSTDGLNQLLNLEYGNYLRDDFLVETWFTPFTLGDLYNTQSISYADEIVPHPITAPLVAYELPVFTWGARSVQVDPFGPGSTASPLLYSQSAFGETDNIFRGDDASPMQLNIGRDPQPRLLIGGIGTNLETGSRIALLGDSELLQNEFGLIRHGDTTQARFVGNEVFLERLGAWLLGLPETEWPDLPSGYTWLLLDGDGADWDQSLPVFEDVTAEVAVASYDLLEVRTFHNDNYVYALIDTALPPLPDTQVEVIFDANGPEATVVLNEETGGSLLVDGNTVSIPDAAIAIGEMIEIRIPIRIAGRVPIIERICLTTASDPESQIRDCNGQRLVVNDTLDLDPVAFLPTAAGPVAIVTSPRTVNLRAGPAESFPIIAGVTRGTPFVATDVNEDGEWVQIENSRYSGWMTRIWLSLDVRLLDPTLEVPMPGDVVRLPEADCVLQSFTVVNKRSGPGLTYQRSGQMLLDEVAVGIGQAFDAGGVVWWQLADGTWVRSDLVAETDGCEDLPSIVPEAAQPTPNTEG